MDRRRRAARTVALMSLFSMTDTRENVPVASFDGDGSDLISLIVGIDPVQAGSGDPSPDNVRPISGRTGANVYRTGKNLCYHDPNVNSNIYNGGNLIPVKAGDKVYCYGEWTYTQSANLWGGIFASQSETSKNNRKVQLSWFTSGEVTEYTITVDGYFGVAYSSGAATYTIEKMMISLSPITGATDYEPYQGNTYAVDWTTEAGTVYGGTLDVTTGKLTVDRANIASYNGETLTGRWISDRDVYSAGTTPTIGAQVVYELATPIVYDLTPTQVTTLIGTNNIWADTGDIKYIEYNI